MTNTPNDPEELDAELRRISEAAAALPLIAPTRDLWPEIEARIGAEVIALQPANALTSTGAAPASARADRSVRPFVRYAIAASLLMAVTATVTWRLARTSEPATVVRAEPINEREGASTFQPAAFEQSVAELDQEIATLRTIVRDRSGELDPATLEILERNVKVIDEAIAESRRALATDPGSRFLSERLAKAYTSKLTLLRDVATLPARI